MIKFVVEKKKRKKAGTEARKESSLRDWFGRKGAKGKKGGWVDCNAPDGKGGYKECAQGKRKKKPACRPTPAACGERGKGKTWGKKSAKGKVKEGLDAYDKILKLLDETKIQIVKEQDEGEEKTVINFPKFKINEKHWGKNLNTEDRAVIERIGAQLRGDDPMSRVSYLQDFLTQTEQFSEDISVGEVIGALMFLDIFASVVYDFNAAVAGFLFEALFAGIFEGFQIDATAGGGEAGTTDVVLNVKPKGTGSKTGVEYSFKLLKEGRTKIEGSFTDIIDGISKSSDASETYLVTLKSGEEGSNVTLKFYEFTIRQDNWFEWIGNPKIKIMPTYEEEEFTFGEGEQPDLVQQGVLGVLKAKIVDGDLIIKPTGQRSLRKYDKIEVEEIDVSKIEGNKRRSKLFKMGLKDEKGNYPIYLIPGNKYKINKQTGSKRVTDYSDSASFINLYGAFLKEGAFTGPNGEDFLTYVGEGVYKTDPEFFNRLKTLPTYGGGKGAGQFVISQYYMQNHPEIDGPVQLVLDRNQFQSAAAQYANLIGDQIFEIFTSLSKLIDDVSGYFLGVQASARNAYANRAKEESKKLAESAEKNLVKVTEDDTEAALRRNKYRRRARASEPELGMGRGVKGESLIKMLVGKKKILTNKNEDKL
tara:strand:+ start:4278 stop:6212 length:1935 start_codon:yes stop_codon:yes gene_type:complete